jgi:hypothetical protein
MEPIEMAAYRSVGRACGFAGLAIVCFMAGLSYEPRLAAFYGALLSLLTTGILLLRAGTARTRPYRRTETWLMLAATERPDPTVAQQLIGSTLREAYLWYARCGALVTAALAASSLTLMLLWP